MSLVVMTSSGGVIECRRYLHTIWAATANLEMSSPNQNIEINLQNFWTVHFYSFTVITMSEQYMRYEAQLRVLICRLCHEGVYKNGVGWHYRKHHRDLPLGIRQELVHYANRFDRCETDNMQYLFPYSYRNVCIFLTVSGRSMPRRPVEHVLSPHVMTTRDYWIMVNGYYGASRSLRT